MAAHNEHHFVPQYYFRRFSERRGCIPLLLKATSQIVPTASIRGQCSRHKFYGSADVERTISRIDGQHARILDLLSRGAWEPENTPELTKDQYIGVFEACLMQRLRTSLEADKTETGLENLLLNVFRDHVSLKEGIANREEILDEIDTGGIRIKRDRLAATLMFIRLAADSVPLLFDLEFRLLRNFTPCPFIFGDAPVVFYNAYMRDVTDRGVLGFQTPGLQIFWPLDSRTLLMLVDGTKYRGRYKDNPIIEVTDPCDVSNLNVLQIHHSTDSIYFGHLQDKNYVLDLWFNHKNAVRTPRIALRIRNDLKVRGEEATGEILHSFEPQLDADLNLTFLQPQALDRRADMFGYYRRPDLVSRHLERFKEEQKNRKTSGMGRAPGNSSS